MGVALRVGLAMVVGGAVGAASQIGAARVYESGGTFKSGSTLVPAVLDELTEAGANTLGVRTKADAPLLKVGPSFLWEPAAAEYRARLHGRDPCQLPHPAMVFPVAQERSAREGANCAWQDERRER